MPSPLAHLAAGYTIYRLSRRHEPQPSLGRVGPLPGLLAVTAAFSLLPDIDSAVGLLLRDFGRFHNNATHSSCCRRVLLSGLRLAGLASSRKIRLLVQRGPGLLQPARCHGCGDYRPRRDGSLADYRGAFLHAGVVLLRAALVTGLVQHAPSVDAVD
jgi:hypothetical protein